MNFRLPNRTIGLIFLLSAIYLAIICVFLNFTNLISASLIGIIFVVISHGRKALQRYTSHPFKPSGQ